MVALRSPSPRPPQVLRRRGIHPQRRHRGYGWGRAGRFTSSGKNTMTANHMMTLRAPLAKSYGRTCCARRSGCRRPQLQAEPFSQLPFPRSRERWSPLHPCTQAARPVPARAPLRWRGARRQESRVSSIIFQVADEEASPRRPHRHRRGDHRHRSGGRRPLDDLKPAVAAGVSDTLRDMRWIVGLICGAALRSGPRRPCRRRISNRGTARSASVR